MYKIMAKLLNGVTLELIGFRLSEVKTGNIRYFGVNDVLTLIQSGKVTNAKLSASGTLLKQRLKVNNDKLDNLENYYAMGGSEFISYEEYSKRGTYAEKVEKSVKHLEEEKRKEVEEFKRHSTIVKENTPDENKVEPEVTDINGEIYVGLRRIDYREGKAFLSLRIYTKDDEHAVLSRVTIEGYDRAEDWKLERSNMQYRYLDLYNLSNGDARNVIETFGNGKYCTVFSNDDEKYMLTNIRVNERVYLGRVHLPQNELVLISDDVIENSVINTVKGLVKTVVAGYEFIDKF